jgi:tRNA-dihydrouridine synthase
MGSGASLIDNQPLAARIIEATKKGAGNLPVSVKTRIGVKQVVTENWVRFLLEQDLAALTVHGRTAAQLSLVPADWREIQKAVEVRNQMKSSTLIIGNGDVESRSQAELLVKECGVDGVMIGRGVLSNPWVFEKQSRDHTKQEKLQILLEHVRLYEDTWQGAKPFINLRKYFKIYAKGFRGAGELREELMKMTDIKQVEELIASE